MATPFWLPVPRQRGFSFLGSTVHRNDCVSSINPLGHVGRFAPHRHPPLPLPVNSPLDVPKGLEARRQPRTLPCVLTDAFLYLWCDSTVKASPLFPTRESPSIFHWWMPCLLVLCFPAPSFFYAHIPPPPPPPPPTTCDYVSMISTPHLPFPAVFLRPTVPPPSSFTRRLRVSSVYKRYFSSGLRPFPCLPCRFFPL